MKKILVIGANSYIGQSFQQYVFSYNKENMTVKLVSASDGSWRQVDYSLYDVVLHLSGVVHRREKKGMKVLYDEVNHKMAVEVAKRAKESDVKQFVFMSTAAVFGSKAERITTNTIPNPTTYYGKSKLAAEQDIVKLQGREFKVAIVRPPLVYGQACKGNYPRLVKLAKLMPIFPDIHNKRSMIYIDTLSEFLLMLIEEEGCGYYHPQDEDYVDTCELVVKIRKEMGKKTCLIGLFNPLARLLAKNVGSINKMFGDCYFERDLMNTCPIKNNTVE